MNVQTSCSRARRQIENTATIAICCSLMACLPLVVSSPVRADDGKAAHATRTYSFSIENGTYENLVNNFARQTGLNVVGKSPLKGTVSLITAEPLTFEEALSRVRTILFHYRPTEPYWLVVHETHIEVGRIGSYYRNLPLERFYAGLDDYQAAALPPNELAVLVFQPDNVGAENLKALRKFMPDYMRIGSLVDEGGAVTVFGLVRDIDRYVKLAQKLHKYLEISEGAE